MALTVDQKRLKATKFPPEFDKEVDIKRVNIDLIKKWIATKITSLLEEEDDIIVETCYNLLEQAQFPNIKEIQIQLTGFLEKNTGAFCKELWNLMLSAQESPMGVPKEMLEAKKLELQQEKLSKAAAERRRQEQGESDMIDQFRRGESRDLPERGRGGGFAGARSDRARRRDSTPPPLRRRRRASPPPRGRDFYRPRGRGHGRHDGSRDRRRSPSESRSRSPPRRSYRGRSPSRSKSPPRRSRRDTSSSPSRSPPRRRARRSPSSSRSRSPPRRPRRSPSPRPRPPHGRRSGRHRDRTRSPGKDRRRLSRSNSRSITPKKSRSPSARPSQSLSRPPRRPRRGSSASSHGLVSPGRVRDGRSRRSLSSDDSKDSRADDKKRKRAGSRSRSRSIQAKRRLHTPTLE